MKPDIFLNSGFCMIFLNFLIAMRSPFMEDDPSNFGPIHIEAVSQSFFAGNKRFFWVERVQLESLHIHFLMIWKPR